MKSWFAMFKSAVDWVRDFLDEKYVKSAHSAPVSRLYRFAHFWLMVWKSFSNNRCPMRASALAYITLLALIPMLFVVFSVSNSILKGEGSQSISHFIYTTLRSMTPPTTAKQSHAKIPGSTNELSETNASTNPSEPAPLQSNEPLSSVAGITTNTNAALVNVNLEPPATTANARPLASPDEMVQTINGFVQNIQNGHLGVLGVLVLVSVAITTLSSIENTFNDIWSVPRGRGWAARIIQYWAVVSLGPLVLGLVLALIHSSHVDATEHFLRTRPFLAQLYQLLPIGLLCLAFALFYLLIPNTKVHWYAALVGGVVGGVLWHLNNYFSVLYVSRWVTNTKIYGSLAIIPVFMAGLYFSWLIVLFGAQVAHAYQNRSAYLQEKQAENINQRGREFVALRLMECLGRRFQAGNRAATIAEIANYLAAPTRLIHQIIQTLLAAQLVVEITGPELAYGPSRPLENITCHDILLAMRAGQGEELDTRDDSARVEVYGEFERILAAERQASSAVTVLAMVERANTLAMPSNGTIKAVTDGKTT